MLYWGQLNMSKGCLLDRSYPLALQSKKCTVCSAEKSFQSEYAWEMADTVQCKATSK